MSMLRVKPLTEFLTRSSIIDHERDLAIIVTADGGSMIVHSGCIESQTQDCRLIAAVCTQIWTCYSQQHALISHTRQQLLTQQQQQDPNAIDNEQLALAPQLLGTVKEQIDSVVIDCDFGKTAITKIGPQGKLLLCLVVNYFGSNKYFSPRVSHMLDHKVAESDKYLKETHNIPNGMLRTKIEVLRTSLDNSLQTLLI